MNEPKRCGWVGSSDLERDYHDLEWGVPIHDDRVLFEFLTLEGAQAGLSWSTILNKRDNYRRLFDGFKVRKIAAYDQAKVEDLLADPGIVRNRLKVESTVSNARAFIRVQQEFGSFDAWLWDLVGSRPIINRWESLAQVPASIDLSDRLSKELKSRGFKFVGSTICYAFMQAVGVVNDHQVDCFRWAQLAAPSGG